MSQYGNMTQLSAGSKYGVQRPSVSEPFVALTDLGFGKAAFGYKGDPNSATDIFNSKNTITYSADFVSLNVINASVNGVAIAPVTFDTDQATTLALVVAAIAALDADYTVTSAGRVITVEAPRTNVVLTSAVTAGATQASVTIGTAAPSGDLVFLGAVIKAQKAPVGGNSGVGYVAGEELEVMRSGYLAVEVDDIANCVENSPVYVILTGTDKGKFTGTAGSNLLTNATFRFFADKAQDVAVVDFQQLPKAVV